MSRHGVLFAKMLTRLLAATSHRSDWGFSRRPRSAWLEGPRPAPEGPWCSGIPSAEPVDGAGSLGNEAVKVGARVGNDALDQIATQAKNRPLVAFAVAIGVGILIGVAVRRS